MTDIVERLRSYAHPNSWAHDLHELTEAANEIERLRFALAPAVSWADEMKRKDDEIERLRVTNQLLKQGREKDIAEIERLAQLIDTMMYKPAL